jgi:simple sugar transport system ATP-binding protein
MVHQHFMLAEPESVLDNLWIGVEPAGRVARLLPRWLQRFDRASARRQVEEVLRRNGIDWDFRADFPRPAGALPVGRQQRLEILKVLLRRAETVILDEPTAVLTPQEVRELFETLKRLRAALAPRKTIVIITHKLGEVMELTDRVTVMRAGKVVAEVETARTSPAELAELMVGRAVPEVRAAGAPVLGERRLSLPEFGLEVAGGEIVGVAGVSGNGHEALIASALRSVPRNQLGYIPADRHREGLCLGRSVEENFLLGHEGTPAMSGLGVLRSRDIRQTVTRALEDFDVRPRDPRVLAAGLSGGNQQKLVIARELFSNPPVVIAAEPTRGVDIGAIEAIHLRLLEERKKGVAILLVSAELDEVLALSDRVVVLYEGRIVDRLTRAEAVGPGGRERIGCGMAGLGTPGGVRA